MFLSRLNALFRLTAVRQTLWLLALFSLISMAAWAGTFFLVQREMLRGVDARLVLRMDTAIAALDAGEILPELNEGETAEFVETERRDGFETRDADGSETEMRYFLRTSPHGRLQLGENTELQEELRDLLAGGMTLSLLATLVVTTLTGIWMAQRSQSRLNTINIGLAAVARGNLDARIELDGEDDLSLLASRINDTTAQLEAAMTQMRVQSSNIAHDLRTPLARLRADVESRFKDATDKGRPISPDAIATALDQIDRITGTFDALLRLARIESGAGKQLFSTVDLGVLVNEVAETYGAVVEDAGQALQIEIAGAGTVLGDRDMLVQLLANLIQNALRHGAERQIVMLNAHGRRLIVSDAGPGIPFEERERVLQPLYQGESTRQSEGFGLGLSLVRAIAELHGAVLTLSDGPNGQGLSIAVQFPDLKEL